MSKFGELINTQLPVLIDFYTEWNEPSVSMHPVIRDVAAALGDKAKVIKIDVDKNQELADLLGFYDTAHFNHTFKKFTGKIFWHKAKLYNLRILIQLDYK